MSEKRYLTKDEQLTVLADCQRILRDPLMAGYLVDGIAMICKRVQQPIIGPNVPQTPQVERARRLGISVILTKDAPAGGEMIRDLYEYRFVYPIRETNGKGWTQRFGKALSDAINRHVKRSAEEVTRPYESPPDCVHMDDDEMRGLKSSS